MSATFASRLAGKRVLVTGGAGGIGLATTTRLLQEGARVFASDINRDTLEDVLEGLDGEVYSAPANVAQEGDVIGLVDAALDSLGGLDAVFNNAGIEGDVAPVHTYSTETYERVMDINVKGVFLVMKYALPHLLSAGGGSIVNVSSVAGLRGSPMIPVYSASKHAVIGLTRSTAEGYASKGIRVNAVCPAPINTRMMRSIETGLGGNEPQLVQERFEQAIPAGRYGEPEEVAALVAFLLSDESKFINGSIYSIDGGMTPY